MNQTIKSSVIAGVLGMAIVTSAIPTTHVQAQTTTDLQAQIAVLLEQLLQLQNKMQQTTSSITLTRNLSIGMTGEDVRDLQRFLNNDVATQVAASGVGSKGNETPYFGPATKAAVIKYQNKYRSEVLTPVGLTAGTGYVGASTRAHMNAKVVVVDTPTNPTTPNTPATPDVSDLAGEGELISFDIESADEEEIHEGEADVEIAVVSLEAEHGDLAITRMDVSLVADVANDERDPWDVFESIALYVDGKKVAEKTIASRSDYQNRTTGTVRLSGLDLVLEEDDETEIIIAVTVKNNVKGAGVNADWSVKVDSVRYKDGQGVVVTDTTTGDLGQSVDFSILERGEGEQLVFKSSNNSPIEQTIVVDNKSKTTNVAVLNYLIEAQGGDIELDTMYVNIQTGTAAYADVVSDIRIKVGGKTFKKDSIVSTGAYSANSVLVSFDINNKITIDEDDSEEVVVYVDLKPKTKYVNGETITAQVTSTERDMTKAEGKDDVDSFSGSVVGKLQTLISDGVYVSAEVVETSTKTLSNNATIGEFKITFTAHAVEGDYYIASKASTSSLSTLGGVQYIVDTTSGVPTSLSAVLDSTARESSDGVYVIREGKTETFTLTVTVDASEAGSHRVALENLLISSNSNGVTDGTTYSFVPKTTFRTGYQFINN